MNPTAVLVLADECSDTTEALFDIGFVPLVRKRMHGALDRLRHERFAAVVVDRARMDVDVLEFVLNARDINEEIPVIVLGQSKDTRSDEILHSQPHVFVLKVAKPRSGPVEQLKQALLAATACQP